jgi:hypothetical protein
MVAWFTLMIIILIHKLSAAFALGIRCAPSCSPGQRTFGATTMRIWERDKLLRTDTNIHPSRIDGGTASCFGAWCVARGYVRGWPRGYASTWVATWVCEHVGVGTRRPCAPCVGRRIVQINDCLPACVRVCACVCVVCMCVSVCVRVMSTEHIWTIGVAWQLREKRN